MKQTLTVLLVCAVILVGCDRSGNRDHLHEEGVPQAHGHAEDSISHTAWTDRIEWFIELEKPEPGKPAAFAAHVTLLEDFLPASEGTFTVEAVSDGKTARASADSPARPGIFTPEITIPSPGTWKLKVSYASAEVSDAIEYEIRVHGPEEELPAGESEADGISFLKEQQWKVPFQTAWASLRPLGEYAPVYGEVIPMPEAHAVIIAPMAGRFLPPSNQRPVSPGTWVEPGQLLGYIEPPLSGPAGTAHLVNRAEFLSSMARIELELLQSRERMEKAKEDLERAKSLLEKKAKSRREVEAAKLEYTLARSSHETAEKLKESLSAAKKESPEEVFRVPLISPIRGKVARVDAVSGGVVESNTEIFELIDLSTVWVTAHVHEQDLGYIKKGVTAYVTSPAYPRDPFEACSFVSIGTIVDRQSKTLPVIFCVENPGEKLKAGMNVTVHVEMKPEAEVLAVSETAIVDEEGRSVVFVQPEGESFEKRYVQTGRRDRGWVEIVSGLGEGERVVTQGAYFVNLASAQTGMPSGHGHPH